MGNCQAAEAEAATVLIQQPCGSRVERVYCSVSANQVMTSNPGHYVALIVTSTTAPPVKYLKLLRPDDTLRLGYVYRLVSFEEVLKEFASKKHVKLSRLLVEEKKRGGGGGGGGRMDDNQESSPQAGKGLQADAAAEEDRPSAPVPRPGQWRPALQSIAETGTYI